MTAYVKRKTTQHKISNVPTISLFHPERTVLTFGERSSQDIGAVCYLRRLPRENGTYERLVDLDSFDKKRVVSINDIINVLASYLLSGRLKKSTLSELTRSFIRFMDWCDDSGHLNVLYDVESARSGLYAFIQHLRNEIRSGSISLIFASSLQYRLISLLSDLFNTDDLNTGLNLIVGGANWNPTSPQDEMDSGRVLALCNSLFEGLSELVLDNRPFPYKLKMPSILEWEDDYLWVVPSRTWCLPPNFKPKNGDYPQRCKIWDYKNGRILNLEEIADKYCNKYAAAHAIEEGKKRLLVANHDAFSIFRLWRAAAASAAFFQLFLANTGMNHAQARELTWHENMEFIKERQGFVGIKARASNKTVAFEIQKCFLSSFKKYLRLRDYLLLNESCNLLFFSRERSFNEKPKKLPLSHTSNFTRIIRRIDPDIPNFGPRQWRANKADWLIRNEDPSTTAAILQNKESTVLKHYAAGSETRAVEEFGGFFEQLTILRNNEPSAASFTPIGVGACNNYGDACPTETSPPVKPDCRQPEGCLFCGHYFIHADETDVRKLVSCRYCIIRTAHLSASPEHFDAVFGSVLERIEKILDLIKDMSKEESKMIDQVITDVECNENLAPYWSEKLLMLIELGVVSH
ncbi:MAG: hypothetical protein KZQ98_07185 [Candidatus Thiodiazotropha sp. (ex Lucinoma borealis)]|nr:hypothetical protein [Candidatus Thiodiazotropha sp. (ex Lucinoma borealis)]